MGNSPNFLIMIDNATALVTLLKRAENFSKTT